MQRYMIFGGNSLKGTVKASGSKNASLPILAACLLVDGEATLYDIPRLQDVAVMKDLLVYLGARVVWEKNTMRVDARNVQPQEVSEELMRRMRASNLVLGPLLSRFQQVKISYPGGCNIGSRQIGRAHV